MLIEENFNCTQEYFNNAKSNTKINITCLYCNETFYRTKKDIIHKYNRGILPKFCDINCRGCYSHLIKSTNINCSNCNKVFNKNIKRITKNNFCSSSCSAIYNNKNKTTGTRRSKLETYLEKQLHILYPTLDIHYNRKDTIGSELDIYIPSLKLAFELNGIFHYEPIYGTEKLNKIQTNDQNKFQLCQQHGISLCIIDTSSQKRFTELSSQKYLEIIKQIINNI